MARPNGLFSRVGFAPRVGDLATDLKTHDIHIVMF